MSWKQRSGFTAAILIVRHCFPAKATLSTDVFCSKLVKGFKSAWNTNANACIKRGCFPFAVIDQAKTKNVCPSSRRKKHHL